MSAAESHVISEKNEDASELGLYRLLGEGYKAMQEGRITPLDEIIKKIEIGDDNDELEDLPVRVLASYANPQLRQLEEGAFEHAVVEKHGKG